MIILELYACHSSSGQSIDGTKRTRVLYRWFCFSSVIDTSDKQWFTLIYESKECWCFLDCLIFQLRFYSASLAFLFIVNFIFNAVNILSLGQHFFRLYAHPFALLLLYFVAFAFVLCSFVVFFVVVVIYQSRSSIPIRQSSTNDMLLLFHLVFLRRYAQSSFAPLEHLIHTLLAIIVSVISFMNFSIFEYMNSQYIYSSLSKTK